MSTGALVLVSVGTCLQLTLCVSLFCVSSQDKKTGEAKPNPVDMEELAKCDFHCVSPVCHCLSLFSTVFSLFFTVFQVASGGGAG